MMKKAVELKQNLPEIQREGSAIVLKLVVLLLIS